METDQDVHYKPNVFWQVSPHHIFVRKAGQESTDWLPLPLSAAQISPPQPKQPPAQVTASLCCGIQFLCGSKNLEKTTSTYLSTVGTG